MVAALVVMSAAVTRADDFHNFYVTADLGGIIQQNANYSENGSPNVPAAFNPGARLDVAVGYNLNENYSIEIAPGFMWNSVDTLDGYSLGNESIDLESIPVLINIKYRINTGTKFTPYLGGGIGADVTIFDGEVSGRSLNDSSAAFAFQLQAGVRYALSQHASVGLGYKFLGTSDQNYSLDLGHAVVDRVTLNGIYIHSIMLDCSWSF